MSRNRASPLRTLVPSQLSREYRALHACKKVQKLSETSRTEMLLRLYSFPSHFAKIKMAKNEPSALGLKSVECNFLGNYIKLGVRVSISFHELFHSNRVFFPFLSFKSHIFQISFLEGHYVDGAFRVWKVVNKACIISGVINTSAIVCWQEFSD